MSPKPARDRIELDRRETLLGGGAGVGGELLRRAAAHEQVQPDPVTILAAEEVPDRRLQVLALDVPEGDVDSADRAAQHRPAERSHAIQVLPVALDLARILAEQVRRGTCGPRRR